MAELTGNSLIFDNGSKVHMEDDTIKVEASNLTVNGNKVHHGGSTKFPVNGQRGQIYMNTQDNAAQFSTEWLVFNARFCETQAELNNAFASGVSQAEIFNTWGRFSHQNSAQPADTSELQAWSYDSSNDVISCTVNSVTYIGFYSNRKYDNYFIDVQLEANVADDDRMGVVIAFAVDSNGKEHTLSALRDNEGFNWRVYYNYYQTDGAVIAQADSAITDGVTWNNYPIGTRIQIRREYDSITTITTQNNNSSFVEASRLSFNLTDDPRLNIFRGKQSYGYGCQSNQWSSWRDQTFIEYGSSAAENYIFYLPTGQVYTPNTNGTFSLDNSLSLDGLLGPGRMCRDVLTGKCFYTTDEPSEPYYRLI